MKQNFLIALICILSIHVHAQLNGYTQDVLGQTAGSSILLLRTAGAGSGNLFLNNHWLYRKANGGDWSTYQWVDGISIDASFLQPGIDTRTWWKREPYANTQSWGDMANTYLTIVNGGNVGIGTTNPGSYKLAVEGKIGAREINVTTTSPWPDYVFDATYELPSLYTIQSYINQNKHLPDVPSAQEIEAKGVDLGEMNMLLLKKVEELTLYVIELKNEIDQIKSKH